MIILWITLFVKVTDAEHGVTPYLAHIDELPNVGKYGDAEHRGPSWYDYTSQSSSESDVAVSETDTDSSDSSNTLSSSESSSASSFETKERKLIKRTYRVCTPCPHEMLKKYKNFGIKWICGSYQRARRSFKSECMMRYRNCEDGTLFVKISDHRCKNDSYHGRHWFYVYRV